MCDPATAITAASAAASAGGSFLNSREDSKTQANMINARNAATLAELERQKVYGNESRGYFSNALDTFSPEKQATGLESAQGGVAGVLSKYAPTADMVGTVGTSNAPQVVADSETRTIGDTLAGGAKRGDALAKVKGYDQQQFGQKIDLNASARDIDRVGDFSKVSSGVSGVEQRAAYNNAYKPRSGIGDLLSVGAQLGSFYGGKGAFGGNTMFNPQQPVGQPLNLLSFMRQ